MNVSMTDYDVIDMTWTHEGVLKVVRSGNAYEWRIYGQHNYDNPLFVGTSGSFFDAWAVGEAMLNKDLKQIFWLLNEASQKERQEGEPKDAELIEQTIRMLNVGDKKKAVYFLDQVISRERAEREPDDVRRLTQAKAMILAEKVQPTV